MNDYIMHYLSFERGRGRPVGFYNSQSLCARIIWAIWVRNAQTSRWENIVRLTLYFVKRHLFTIIIFFVFYWLQLIGNVSVGTFKVTLLHSGFVSLPATALYTLLYNYCLIVYNNYISSLLCKNRLAKIYTSESE